MQADNDGIYKAPNLVPGRYEISASKSGFETVVRSGVLVKVGSEETIDFKLNLGEVQAKIEVSGTPPAIQLASSTLDATENSTTVRELPLNGRDWTTLAQLQPGVTNVYQLPLGLSNQRANRGLGTQLSIGGAISVPVPAQPVRSRCWRADYQKQDFCFRRLRRNSSVAFNNNGGHCAFCRGTHRASNRRYC
jgi:Carboxypeptidase regulatory-like domain